MAIILWCSFCSLCTQPLESTMKVEFHNVVSALKIVKGQALAYLFIRKGMPKEEARKILGVPSIEYSACGHTTYVYLDYHLQLWFENDCPRKRVVYDWKGNKETCLEWADNPCHARYKDRLTMFCIH